MIDLKRLFVRRSRSADDVFWDRLNAMFAARARRFPTAESALEAIHAAQSRLRDLGWNDAIYCPKDGSEFDAIELGSETSYTCVYIGDWPSGTWFMVDEDDMYPAHPALFKKKGETST